jgi:nucleosome binding factor SPN SPT16 subunit
VWADERRETLVLPVCGSMVPFHAASIKTVQYNPPDDSKFCYLRVNFYSAGQAQGAVPYAPAVKHAEKHFLREITYR